MKVRWLALMVFGVSCSAMTVDKRSEEKLKLEKDGCWKQSFGENKIPNTCEQDLQLDSDSLLCFPYCQNGYTGLGPVCWQNCPSGWRDKGSSCSKPPPYNRGSGYIRRGECESNHGTCEMWGQLWYPTCANGYYPSSCCVCSHVCPAGMTDTGVSCDKQTYDRGVGESSTCTPGMDSVSLDGWRGLEYEAALCNVPCPATYDGVGPVCWKHCPVGTKNCGALCVVNSSSCTKEILDKATWVMKAVMGLYIMESPEEAAEDTLYLLQSYGYPICNDK